MRPRVLSLGASIPLAGIQLDLQTLGAHGVDSHAVTTCVGATDAQGCLQLEPVAAHMVHMQLQQALTCPGIHAWRLGVLGSVDVVARLQAAHPASVPVVWEPSLALEPSSLAWQEVLPWTSLLVLGAQEAEQLTRRPVRSADDAQRVGTHLLERGTAAVLLVGGYQGAPPGLSTLVTAGNTQLFTGDARVATQRAMLACAVAAQLAWGLPLVEAVAVAVWFVSMACSHPWGPLFALHEQHAAAAQWRQRISDAVQRGDG